MHWAEVTQEKKQHMAAVKKSLAKIMMREMYGAFSSWSDNASTIAHQARRCRLTLSNPR